jgi:hypothetical protein
MDGSRPISRSYQKAKEIFPVEKFCFWLATETLPEFSTCCRSLNFVGLKFSGEP